MRYVLCAVALASLAAPVWAGSLSEQAVTAAAVAADQKPAGFGEWSRKLEVAKEKRDSGKRLALVGFGVGVGAEVLGALTNSTVLYVAGGVGGGAMGLAGILRAGSASGTIQDLDQEGRIKGYLSLGPTPGRGVQAMAHVSF